ncbi:MAG: hypothetical protein H7Z40_20455 [Phycisphaerae bacterium]|nr:hypothetical protein [Gemmatimonadaceae bacterium]
MKQTRIGGGCILLFAACVAAMSACDQSERGIMAGEGTTNSPTQNKILTSEGARGIESEMLRIERDIPGFGGFYQDTTSGDLVAYVTDLSDAAAVSERLSEFVTDRMVRRRNGSRSAVVVRQGQYPLSTLIEWQRTIAASLRKPNNVILLDADEHLNRVRIGVTDSASVPLVQELTTALGIPALATDIQVRPGRFRLTANLTDKHRPQLGAGIVINDNTYGCTMGFHVTDSTGARFFLTASHCTQTFTGAAGVQIYQKNFVSDYVGYDMVNPAWATTGCYIGTLCRAGDVALITLDSSSFLRKQVAITTTVGTSSTPGNTTIAVWRDLTSPQDMWYGAFVSKTGKTSGTTQGYVVATCVIVGDPTAIPSLETDCADAVNTWVSGGDSGGPVFRFTIPLATTVRQPHGIVFGNFVSGGYIEMYYTTWSVIQSEIGRTLFPY